MEMICRQTVKNRITETVSLAVKTTALVIAATIFISVIFNIPLYLMRFVILAPLGFTALGFLDTLPFSYLGANIFFLLALRNYLSGCGEELLWKYFPVGLM
jgi:hypothetical protein